MATFQPVDFTTTADRSPPKYDTSISARIGFVLTLRNRATARLRGAWFSDRNHSCVIATRAAVVCFEDFLDDGRNLFSSPTVVQALSQCGHAMHFSKFLQKIGSIGVRSPTFQVQYEVIDKLGRVIEDQLTRNLSSDQPCVK